MARVAVGLEVNEIGDVIACRIAVWVVPGSMLVQPTFHIVRDSGVQESSVSIAKDVDVISSHAQFVDRQAGEWKGHRV